NLLAQLFDVGALLADHDARARGIDRDAALLVRPLDQDLRDTSLLELLLEVFPDLHVLMKQLAVFAMIGVPTRIPGAMDPKAQADRIDFLTHQAASSISRTMIVSSLKCFSMRPTRPRARGVQRFITRFLPTKASATTSWLMSRSWLFSALAIADSSV